MQVVWGNRSGLSDNLRKTDQVQIKDLVNHFSRDLFIARLHATTKEASLEEFADLFVGSKLIRKRDILIALLSKRETLGSTGIGKGIAIPHGRTTAALEVKIAFGKSEAGIDFDATDQEPVHLIFVVLAPPHDDNNHYLPILAKLVEVLNQKANRKKLLAVESYDEFIRVFEEAG